MAQREGREELRVRTGLGLAAEHRISPVVELLRSEAPDARYRVESMVGGDDITYAEARHDGEVKSITRLERPPQFGVETLVQVVRKDWL